MDGVIRNIQESLATLDEKTKKEPIGQTEDPTSFSNIDLAIKKVNDFSSLNPGTLVAPPEEFIKPRKDPFKLVVIKTRKPKKNIKKRLIIGISTLAPALVLLASKEKSPISKKIPKEAINTTIEEIGENPDDLIKELDTESILTEFTERQIEKESLTEGRQQMTESDKEDEINSEKNFAEIHAKEDKAFNQTEQSTLKIGGTIQLQESAGIYRDELSAYLDEPGQNALEPYWSNSDEKICLGGLYETSTGEFCYIYANDEKANQKQSEIIQNGGNLLSALIAQPSEYYKVYDGEKPLTLADINKCAAGWIRAGDIKTNNSEVSRGMKR